VKQKSLQTVKSKSFLPVSSYTAISAIVIFVIGIFNNFDKMNTIDNASLVILSSMTFVAAITLWHQYNDARNWSDIFENKRNEWLHSNGMAKKIEKELTDSFKESQRDNFSSTAKHNDSIIKKASINSAIILLIMGFVLSPFLFFFGERSMHISFFYVLNISLLTIHYLYITLFNRGKNSKSLTNLLDKDLTYFVKNTLKEQKLKIASLTRKNKSLEEILPLGDEILF
jgi:hypothetical protein